MLNINKLWEEFEWVSELGGLLICVDKVGGGTPPREYVGDWEVTVFDVNGARLDSNLNVRTGMPHSHRWVAEFVSEGLSDDQ